MSKKKKKKDEANPEPEERSGGRRLSGEPDSNLAAVGGGGIAGAVTGAAIGAAVGGPVGGVIGAAAGAVAGGTAADQVQNRLDPKVEELYWEETYPHRPYYREGDKYEVYRPAFRLGWEAADEDRYAHRNFEEVEPELRGRWKQERMGPADWDQVRPMVEDAFLRVRNNKS